MINTSFSPPEKETDKCADFQTRLWLFLDNELPENERERWVEHANNCERCERELMQARAMINAYRKLGEYDVDEAFFENAIRQATMPEARKTKVFWKRKLIYWSAPLAAAAALFIFILLPNDVQQENLGWKSERLESRISLLDDAIYRVESSELPMVIVNTDEYRGSILDMDLQYIEQRIEYLADELASDLQ